MRHGAAGRRDHGHEARAERLDLLHLDVEALEIDIDAADAHSLAVDHDRHAERSDQHVTAVDRIKVGLDGHRTVLLVGLLVVIARAFLGVIDQNVTRDLAVRTVPVGDETAGRIMGGGARELLVLPVESVRLPTRPGTEQLRVRLEKLLERLVETITIHNALCFHGNGNGRDILGHPGGDIQFAAGIQSLHLTDSGLNFGVLLIQNVPRIRSEKIRSDTKNSCDRCSSDERDFHGKRMHMHDSDPRRS